MQKKMRFLVIGLGKFGFHVAKTLYEDGHEVVAVDADHDRVQRAAEHPRGHLWTPRQGAARRPGAGGDRRGGGQHRRRHHAASDYPLSERAGGQAILTKAVNEDHGKILTRVGAREIIEPEKAQAVRTAKGLSSPNLIDFLPLEQDYSLSQLAPPRKLVGKSLAESELRNRYHVYVIAIKETVPDNFVMLPPANFVIKDSDILVLVGRQEDIEKLGELI